MDALFRRLQPFIASDVSSTGITIEELDERMKKSHEEVISIRDGLNSSITNLSSRLENMSNNMDRQNSIILGMEGQFRDTFSAFSDKIKELHDLIRQTSTSNTPSAASTGKQVHWGGGIK
jgi:predicted  nucleic acid-binding Zn-ribbon protein